MKHLLTATIVATSLTAFADVPPPIDPRPLPTTPIVRRGAELPTYTIAQGKGTATIYYDAAVGSPDAAMTLLVLQPGAAVPAHTHPGSVEMLYVLEGEARMEVAGESFTLHAGDAARIPMDVLHRAEVVGDRALRAVQIYTPAGPEQRFKSKP